MTRRQQSAPSWYGKQVELARETAERWNERHPVGTTVNIFSGEGDLVFRGLRTTSAACEMAGGACLFFPVLRWVPLSRIRISQDGREAQARNDLAARAHPHLPSQGLSPSDDGDDRRAVVRGEERAEVGHTSAVGDGSGSCAGSPSGKAAGSCPAIAGSTPAPASTERQHETATSIRVLCSLLFSGGSLTLHRLADRCNLTTQRCGQALSVLHSAGLVENPRHGHWRAKRLVVALHRELVSVVAAQVEARHARLR